ncbi:MAG TPA: helix-turn-helix transcriptional regulator [Thermoanaerobaculia bacterium]|nr:helix-turn-helix transcriptional regulator [Thermoanaerobaculia bacterium]
MDTAGGDAEFLRAFGLRVRHERSLRSLTRRAVAEKAGISERYITQLESGKGNVSLLVLRQIARALGIPLDQLVRDAEPVPGRTRRIALIGMRGAGKSTLGARLARTMDVPFFELDQEIERIAGMSLAALIEMYGQAAYRRYESQALHALLDSQPEFVVATGGGIVSEPDTYELLLHHCFTVWIRATPEEHMQRVIEQGDLRPMAGSARAMDDLRRILKERTPLYARADATVNTSGVSEGVALKQLLELRAPSEL